MSKGKILLLVLIVLIIVLAVAAVISDRKYAAIISSPRVSYETLVKPETRAIIAVDPGMAGDVIAKMVQGVPAVLLPLALPNQGAFLIDLDYVVSDMRLTAFINDKRFGPIICERINGMRLPVPLNQWLKENMRVKERGVLLREGTARVDRNFVDRIREYWPEPEVPGPPKLQGGHLFEAAFENRDGSAFAILATFAAAARHEDVTSYLDSGHMGMMSAVDMLKAVNMLRATADITPQNELNVNLTFECANNPDTLATIQMMLDFGFAYLQPVIAQKGAEIQGKSAVSGTTVTGAYVIKNYEALLGRKV